jgi:hypothetical protein
LIISLNKRRTIKLIKITNPMSEIMFLIPDGISFLITPSIVIINKCHPSKPGNGNKLKIAKLTDIKAQI